jgi:hypothetical protein
MADSVADATVTAVVAGTRARSSEVAVWTWEGGCVERTQTLVGEPPVAGVTSVPVMRMMSPCMSESEASATHSPRCQPVAFTPLVAPRGRPGSGLAPSSSLAVISLISTGTDANASAVPSATDAGPPLKSNAASVVAPPAEPPSDQTAHPWSPPRA